MSQPNLSHLEKNSDMVLSMLRSYVEAIEGRLSLTVVVYKPLITLAGLGDLIENQKSKE